MAHRKFHSQVTVSPLHRGGGDTMNEIWCALVVRIHKIYHQAYREEVLGLLGLIDNP